MPPESTRTEKVETVEEPLSTAERAAPASTRSADFGIDTTARTTGEALRAYLGNLRSGELGALPALLGLAALFVLFTVLDTGGTFPSLLNLANLLQQGAGQTIIAMGLVFVLLTGEIDLAAGTASGLAAAVMALHLVSNGNLLGGMGTTVFVMFLAAVVVAIVLALLLRIWFGAAFSALALVLMLIGFPPNPWLEMLLAVCVGVVIGCLTGFFVARFGMPSFVVTLALFIAWQGVILQLIGDGGTLGLRDDVIIAAANGSLSTAGSWLLFVVGAGGYAAVLLNRQRSRRKLGLVAQPTGLVLMKVGAVVLLAAIATF
ncbi:MAG: ABC transporter permease, partial [Pseudonocardia sp.]